MGERIQAVRQFFGADAEGHCFHVEPHHWLRLTEPQATRGLALFLTDGGAHRILGFLRALDAEIEWPESLVEASATAEVPAGKGRIDLLVQGKSEGQVWGAVVEAKFGHHPGENPLGDYARHAAAVGMAFPHDEAANRTGVLAIVGQKECRFTTRRLARNKRWRFVSWQELLRRFEAELAADGGDLEFRRFRRTLWERST